MVFDLAYIGYIGYMCYLYASHTQIYYYTVNLTIPPIWRGTLACVQERDIMAGVQEWDILAGVQEQDILTGVQLRYIMAGVQLRDVLAGVQVCVLTLKLILDRQSPVNVNMDLNLE